MAYYFLPFSALIFMVLRGTFRKLFINNVCFFAKCIYNEIENMIIVGSKELMN